MNHTQLAARELELYRRIISAQGEIGLLDRQLNETDDNFVKVLSRRSAMLGEIDTLTATIRQTRAGRPEAIRKHFASVASELSSEIAKKTNERAELMRKTNKHLAALSEIEGVVYEQVILLGQPRGPWLKNVCCAYSFEDQAAHERQLDPTNNAPFVAPRSRKLLDEILSMQQRIEDLERREPRTAGQIDAESIDALLEQAVADPVTIAPEIIAIAEWAEKRCAEFLKDRPGARIEKARFTIAFHNSKIVMDASKATFTSRSLMAAA